MNSLTFYENQVKIYLSLHNPLRCLIIDLLKSHRCLTSSEIADMLHINLNKCIYHLQNLNDLVQKDNQNRYSLTNKGKKIFQQRHIKI